MGLSLSPSARRVLVEIPGGGTEFTGGMESPSARRVLVEIGRASSMPLHFGVTLREEGVG